MADESDEQLAGSSTSNEALSGIRELSIGCRELFHQLSANYINGAQARELMASFNIWVANMGVFREGQQSLTSRLNNAPQIRELVQQLLVALKCDLEKAMIQEDGQEESSSSSESENSSDRSSTPSYRLLSPSDDDDVSPTPPHQSAPWDSVHNTITSLRQLVWTVQLAGAWHRQERIQRFKNLDRNKQVYQLFKDCAHQTFKFRFPNASKGLQERMVESVATRRVRLLYLKQHQMKTSTLNESATAPQQVGACDVNEDTLPAIQPQQHQEATILPLQQGNLGLSLQPSVVLSTTDVTKLDLKQLQSSQNKAKRVDSVSSVKIPMGELPQRPKLEAGGTSFTCPYCFLVCPAKEASGDEQWMAHLIHDFEPFFCVFDDCSSPFMCADTYSGWLAHMRDTHTQPEWHCWHCQPGLQFSKPAELETHLENHHQTEIPDSFRSTLVKHSMVHDQHALQDCPFCGGYPEDIENDHPDRDGKKAREALEKHVRDHLVSVSMIMAPVETGQPDSKFEDTQSEAQRGNDSERDLDGVTDTYELECRNDSCDCQESENNSVLDSSTARGHLPWEMADSQMITELWQEVLGESIAEQCEAAMSALFKRIEERGKSLFQDDVKEIQDILSKAGKTAWSARPRTYTVLRMINMVDLMDEFVDQGFLDYNFPYSKGRIPINVRPQSARNKFFEKQRLVLTDIKDAETGKHASLAIEADPHFTNLKKLGGGGQGIVERVTSKLSLRDYARKTMLRSRKFEGSGEAETAFANELQNLKRLSHRHLVKYVGSYTDPRAFAILLLPVADMDLKTFLSRAPFPEGELSSVREYFGCITAGIAHLHRFAIRHKDITPRNILIKDNKIFVTDFGLSLDWSEVSKSKADGPRGKVTRDYVAPEVWDENERGSASDLWPLGCVFLDMVTILKGRSLEQKLQFFETNGSKGRNPRENYDAYLLWMQELRKLEPGRDTQPLLWTERLISMKSDERGTADELLFAITNSEDEEDGYMYNCLSCADDFGSEFPIMSIPIGADSDDNDGDSVPDQGGIECLDRGLCQSVTRGDENNVVLWLRRWEKRADFSTEISSCKALHTAARLGKTTIMKELIKHGFDVNNEIDGHTPLHEATEGAQFEAMRLLLHQDADPNVANHNQNTVLIATTNLGNKDIVVQLLANGADINGVGRSHQTALHQAAALSHAEIVRLLLEHPDTNMGIRDNSGYTPLMLAVEGHSELVAELLLARCSDADVQGLDTIKTWVTPLHVAAMGGGAGIIRMLIARGAQVNARSEAVSGATPVHFAADRGDLQVLEAMFEGPVEPDVQDSLGRTALHVAVAGGHQDVVPWLRRKGFDIEKENATGARPLGVALLKEDFDMAKLLIDQGADIDGMPLTKHEPYLHVAVLHERLSVLDFLIQHGASIDLRDTTRNTALMLAAARGKCTCISRLITAGANIHERGPDQVTAACVAVINDQQEALQLLLDNGADRHVQASGSNNLLHFAAMQGLVSIGKFLLEIGVSMTAKNAKGDTPLDIAKLQGHQDFVALLKDQMRENQEEVRARRRGLVRRMGFGGFLRS